MITNFQRDSNGGAGCGPWLLLLVGYIVVLTAIGISCIIISVETRTLQRRVEELDRNFITPIEALAAPEATP